MTGIRPSSPRGGSFARRRAATPRRRSPTLRARRLTAALLAAALGVVVLLATLLWAIAMPIRDLPAPTGAHPVGTITYDLVDSARPEQYRLPESDSPTRRTIRLQLWYPAAEEDAASGAPTPWMADGPRHVRAIVRTHGFPAFIWEHTRFMSSNSYHAAAPGGPSTYPLAIIVHGWEGYRGLHADIAEELASQGYVVAAADHSYGAAATRLEDGTILRARDDVLPDRGTGALFAERAAQLVGTFAADIASIREHLATLDDRVPPGPAPAGALSGADRAVLDALSGRVDTGNLSLIGHSTGGGAAVAYALDHPDVAALVGLDAWVEPLGQRRLESAGLTMPSLFLKSEEWIGHHNEPFLEPWLSRQQAAGLPVTFEQTKDTTHAQFSALYMYAPGTRWVGLLGDADPRAFAMYQRRRIREFVLGQEGVITGRQGHPLELAVGDRSDAAIATCDRRMECMVLDG